MKVLSAIIALIIIFSASSYAQRDPTKAVWKPGVVERHVYDVNTQTLIVDTYRVDDTDPNLPSKREITLRDDWLSMRIRTEDGLYYIGQNLRFIWQTKLNIDENEPVQVRASDGQIQIRTAKGKKAKYRYLLFVPKEFDTGH